MSVASNKDRALLMARRPDGYWVHRFRPSLTPAVEKAARALKRQGLLLRDIRGPYWVYTVAPIKAP